MRRVPALLPHSGRQRTTATAAVPPPAVSVHRNTRVCAGNAPRASAKRLENKRVIVHLPSCHTAAGPGVAKCWTHARRKSKNKKQKTSETAIKSLEELSRVMRCRQSIPSFYPHVKSAPPSSHNMCKQHFVYYERKHRNVLVQLHLERKKWRDVHFSCFLSQIYIYSWGKCIISQVTKLCRFSHK